MFLNCTSKPLTKAQTKEAEKYVPEHMVLELKDIMPDLHQRLANCPSDYEGLINLFYEWKEYLLFLKRKVNGELYLHFPVGSPFFMALFFIDFPKKKGFNFVYSQYQEFEQKNQGEKSIRDNHNSQQFLKFLIIKKGA